MAWPTLPTTEVVDWKAAALLTARRYCGWHVAPVIEEDLDPIDGPGGHALLVPSGRLLEVLKIVEDGVELDPASLEISRDGIIRKADGSRWTDKLGAIKMTIKHGHEMFDDLIGVIEQVAARSAATGSGAVSAGAGPFSIRRGTTSGGSVAGAPLLLSEKATLDPYRISWGV